MKLETDLLAVEEAIGSLDATVLVPEFTEVAGLLTTVVAVGILLSIDFNFASNKFYF